MKVITVKKCKDGEWYEVHNHIENKKTMCNGEYYAFKEVEKIFAQLQWRVLKCKK